MKKNNKGFSLVELIIVIAIMAILAGALAPALIKYIAKSRKSTDISNAQTLATAVTNTLSEETAFDDVPAAGATITVGPSGVSLGTITGTDFSKTFTEQLNGATYKTKYIKNGSYQICLSPTSGGYNITINVLPNGGSTSQGQVYPEQTGSYQ